MFCPQCGAPNDDESIFCGNCGAVLDPDAEPIEASEEAAAGEAVAAPEAGSVEKVLDVAPAEQVGPEEETGREEYGQPATYPQPAYGQAPPSPPTSGMAIAALALGISGLTVFPFLGSILALIFGYMARNEIRQRPDEVSGEGLAVAGLVTGWIGVGLTVLSIVAVGGFFLCGLCTTFGAGMGS